MTVPPSDLGPDVEVLPSPDPFLPMSFTIDLSRLPSAATALGVGLVSAAVALSAAYSRKTGSLDASNFTMGVLATLGLLGLAVAAHLLAPGAEQRAALVSWPGAAGAIAAGVMLGVLITNDDASLYVGAGAALMLSVAGYLLSRAAPFLLGAIAAAAVLYGKVFDDSVGFGRHGDNPFMVVGAAILGFVLVVTAVGWLLPATRNLTGIVVGAGGLVAFIVLLEALSFSAAVASYGSEGPVVHSANPYRDDTYVVLAYCGVLAVVWSVCSLATGHVGYRILALVTAVVVVPVVAALLAVDHPTWWEVLACGLGAAALVVAVARARRPENVERPEPTAAASAQ